ncbi:MAG: amidohydrolase [Bacteroidota bacterium]
MQSLTAFRKELHQNPELSGKEFETQKCIIEFLSNFHPNRLDKIAKTGVMAIYEGEEEGKCILVRGDIDALPIQEINEFDHKSKKTNVSHKCGHDGHTTILCGVAQLLNEQGLKRGKVVLVFQPAEENGEGAKAVIDDPLFKDIKPDFVFALHNLPSYPLNQIVYRNGSFNASVKSIIIKLHGKTAHAAEPEMGTNPANAISELIQALKEFVNPELEDKNFALLTPIRIDMGELAYGVSAGYGELHYTLRTWGNNTMEVLQKRVEASVKNTAEHFSLKVEISWLQEFYANQNDQEVVDLIIEAARLNNLEFHEREVPFKWGEDFGLFTDRYKGAMFGIGSGEDCPALHNPDYDFPDAIIESGVKMFRTLIELAQEK